jgi:outer membrane protein OmpA-like peptidoglycan-associated protein
MRTKQTLLVAALTALFGGVATANTDVKFKFDSAELPESAENALQDIAGKAMASSQRVVLDGHTDPIGTGPYNVALSLRRAEAVKEKLISMGVDSSQIVMTSFGEDKLLGASYAAERRVAIRLSGDSVNELVAQAFADNGTSVHWDKPLTVAEMELPASEMGDAVASR